MTQSRRITIALLVAFIFSGGVTFLLSRRMEHQAALQRQQTLSYVAVARSVEAGEVLKATDLRLVSWPASNPVHGGLTRLEEVTGRTALYPLDAGQPLVDRVVTPPGIGPGLASKIPDGMRAIALRSDEVVGVAGFLAPGSHLDVLVTYHTSKSPDPMTAIVLQNAEVVAAGHQVEPDPDGKSSTVTVVTLLLTPQESERAVLASTQGTIHFILRNRADKGRTDSAPLSLSQLSSSSMQGAAAADRPPSLASGSYIRRSRSQVQDESSIPYRIETVLGDQASVDKGSIVKISEGGSQ